jgi:hypothetical protein
MERQGLENQRGGSHGWLPMLAGCGLMLVGLLVLSSVGPGWGIPLILAALLICPLALVFVSRSGKSDRTWPAVQRQRREHAP